MNRQVSQHQRSKMQGYALLVIVAMIGLMGAISLGVLAVATGEGDRQRVTRLAGEYQELRRAITGDKLSFSDRNPWKRSCYVLDMGAFPLNLGALRAPPPGLIPPPQSILERGVVVCPGWRGPYLPSSVSAFDPWGKTWHYSPPTSTMNLILGSWGRDGRPGGAPGSLDEDFPPNLGISADEYSAALSLITCPEVKFKIAKRYDYDAGEWIDTEDETLMLHVGFVYPGIDWGAPFLNHESLIRDHSGQLVVRYAGKTPSGGSNELKHSHGSLRLASTVWQVQLAVYDANRSGSRLTDKLLAAHPHVLRLVPHGINLPSSLNPQKWHLSPR